MLRVDKEVLKLNTFVALQGRITGISQKIDACFLFPHIRILKHSLLQCRQRRKQQMKNTYYLALKDTE